MPLNSSKELQVLRILSDNLNCHQPELVQSTDIARQLNLSLTDTKMLLKVMDDMGVIENNVDGQLSLITRKGLARLELHTILPFGEKR